MKRARRKVVTKGERLNWTFLKDAKPVKVTQLHVKGRVLTVTDLKTNAVETSTSILVP